MSSDSGDAEGYFGCFQQPTANSHHVTQSRRRSYGQSHFSQQLSAQPIIFKDSVGSQDNLRCSSPYENCYSSGRQPIKFEENISCCIPPPSPAPNNDRFSVIPVGIPGAGHRLIVQQHQRAISPNTRYHVQDRYRDPSSNGHFLINSTPLASNESYTTYLSSTVHTPVKRYIPTPPLCSNDQVQYNESTTLNTNGYHLSLPPNQNTLNQIGSSQTLKPAKSRTNHQQQQNLPYRINMKCCSDKQQVNSSTLKLSTSHAADHHYATTPRFRSSNMNNIKSNHSIVSNSSPSNSLCCTQLQSQCEYGSNSADYTNSNRIFAPINFQNDQSCLNCRRTTGVHQTTQTTGPTSPIPLQQLTSSTDSHSHQVQSPISPQPSSSQSISSVNSQDPNFSNLTKMEVDPNMISQTQIIFSSTPQPLPEKHQAPPLMSTQDSANLNCNNRTFMYHYHNNDTSSNSLLNTSAVNQRTTVRHQQNQSRYSRKQKIKDYIKSEIARFFGVDVLSEEEERAKWFERQKRLAIRCFGHIRDDTDSSAPPHHQGEQQLGYRPDILPAHNTEEPERVSYKVQKKASVITMMLNGIAFLISHRGLRKTKQWSRSFAPAHVKNNDDSDLCDGLTAFSNDEIFFDSSNQNNQDSISRQIYSTSSTSVRNNGWQIRQSQYDHEVHNGIRISSQLLDGILDNSRRPMTNRVKLVRPNELDDKHDYRPFFTYWINAVHILILLTTLICYGIVAFGIGMEQKTGQVMITNLNLQQVSHQEQRNVWIGPRSMDLVHLGAKFGGCMRRDIKVLDVIAKTKRKERETACCIRNDDSGCVQTSQAECSVGGLWPTQKTISTWKKWSQGEGPGGRISGSVCGLDPKYCDAPLSFEWPDDITKWPICRKTNSFSHRSRLKDHTAEHMVCEIIGHPCCTGVYGECRITTKEYCEFIYGYFHEEASLCSQVSCMSNVCGMFPFFSYDVPDQFYRLFTSLYLHAGVLHLAITIAFHLIFLSDLERYLGSIRTAIIYITSGIAGNLASAIFIPYRPEVGPLASLAGVVSSLTTILTFCNWKHLRKPYLALIKLLLIASCLFGISTLPWQLNFIGLISGLLFGVILTFALVPFLNFKKYNRKSKINLIWTCILTNFIIYIVMFILFYIFPSVFSFFIKDAHSNDQLDYYDDHNLNGNQNVFTGVINNYNTGGGIVSSIRPSKFYIPHKNYL